MTSYVVTFHHLILLCYHAYIFVLIVHASSILFVDNNANETVGQHVVHFSFFVCFTCMLYLYDVCFFVLHFMRNK